MCVKDVACNAVTFHINALGEIVDSAQRAAWLNALDKIDPLFEASSWIHLVADEKPKITKVEHERPKTFYTESLKKVTPQDDNKSSPDCSRTLSKSRTL